MSAYQVRYTPRARQDLRKLPLDLAQKSITKIDEIKADPYQFIKKLKASKPNHPVYSLRVRRDIRAILSIHDDVLIIHILEIEHRKQAYRDF